MSPMKVSLLFQKEQELATNPLSILFVASEVEGLIKSGGLADVAKALPEALVNLQHDARIAIPAYTAIPDVCDDEIILDTHLESWPHTHYQVKKRFLGDTPVYLIACAHYFDRPSMYAENNQAYTDNGERFAFFSCCLFGYVTKDWFPA